jgi:hypothetical protein
MCWNWGATSLKGQWMNSPIWRKLFGCEMTNLILYNGKIFSQDPNFPQATAVAMRNGRILAVGSDSEVRALADAHTRQVDLEGRRVLPVRPTPLYYYDWALNHGS